MTDSINFKGIHYAQCRGLAKNGKAQIIDFYKITKRDEELIQRIEKATQGNIEVPLLCATGQAKREIDSADVFIAVCENKPIGIMSANLKGKNQDKKPYYHLHALATWGKDKQFWNNTRTNKVQNTGKGLVTILFDKAHKLKINNITLTSIYDSDIFYKKNGFITTKPGTPRKYYHDTSKDMNCDLNSELVNKNIEDIGLTFTNSTEDVSINHLKTDFETSRIEDYIFSGLRYMRSKLSGGGKRKLQGE